MRVAEDVEHEYLTARELAHLLRVRERKVYELAAAGDVPCSRATGKLLFRRAAVDAWITRASTGPTQSSSPARSEVFVGSHDPLLDWALRESEAGLASLFDGSLDGIERFAARDAIAAGLHVPDDALAWNVPLVRARFAAEPVVLITFARRTRGLIVPAGDAPTVHGIADLAGRRVVPRQAGAGSQMLFERLVARAAVAADAFERVAVARTESDAALAVAEGRADIAFGLAGPARQLGLGFVPIAEERFDLLVDRREWFEPPLQRLAGFFATRAFEKRAAALGGYAIDGIGTVRFNGSA